MILLQQRQTGGMKKNRKTHRIGKVGVWGGAAAEREGQIGGDCLQMLRPDSSLEDTSSSPLFILLFLFSLLLIY